MISFEDVINMHLQEAAEELRQEQIDLQYEELIELPYYLLECEQMDYDMEFYNEFG